MFRQINEVKKEAEQLAKRAREASAKLSSELKKPRTDRDRHLIDSLTVELRGISAEAGVVRKRIELITKSLPDDTDILQLLTNL